MTDIKIGSRVRFLSDVGGGKVVGFQKGNIVLVEDEDGFQIPTLMSDVVVIETEDYNTSTMVDVKKKQKAPSLPQGEEKEAPHQLPRGGESSHPDGFSPPLGEAGRGPETRREPADRPITFKPKVEERKDGEQLNVFLAFVPVTIKELSKTKFECYIVNDCNYFINYTYLSASNAAWVLRSQGTIEPNTKVFIEELDHTVFNDIEKVGVQLIAYKQDKPFQLKPAISVSFRIDVTKFYKLHTFRESLFFDEPTLEYDIVRDDRPIRPLVVSAQELKKAMYEKEESEKNSETQKLKNSKTHTDRNVPIEVDLHAHELLETTSGMSAGDIKEYQLGVFRKTMDEHIKEKGRRIVFIHGKGDGILRNAIITELKHRYKSCTYQDASFQQYGFGATMVIIH